MSEVQATQAVNETVKTGIEYGCGALSRADLIGPEHTSAVASCNCANPGGPECALTLVDTWIKRPQPLTNL